MTAVHTNPNIDLLERWFQALPSRCRQAVLKDPHATLTPELAADVHELGHVLATPWFTSATVHRNHLPRAIAVFVDAISSELRQWWRDLDVAERRRWRDRGLDPLDARMALTHPLRFPPCTPIGSREVYTDLRVVDYIAISSIYETGHQRTNGGP